MSLPDRPDPSASRPRDPAGRTQGGPRSGGPDPDGGRRGKRSGGASGSPGPSGGSAPPAAVRLNRFLAAAGFGSRRQCDELIRAGRVQVDGQPVDRLAVTIRPGESDVRVDGVPLKRQKLVYFAVNKPVGVVTTNADPQGRPRVIDLVPPGERVFPVGRLDRSSEGLILLTNDGELAQRLAHPRFGIRKIYRVTVAGRLDAETMRQMRRGIYIAEGLVRVDGAKILRARDRATDLEIVLREGKNREIRRILARLGHKVQQLRRIAIGPLRLGDTPPGAYRVLQRDEVRKLHDAADAAERGEWDSTDERARGTRPMSSARGAAGKPRGDGKPRSDGKPRASGKRSAETRPAGTRRSQRPKVKRAAAGGPRQADSGTVIGADPPAGPIRPAARPSAGQKGGGGTDKGGVAKRGGKQGGAGKRVVIGKKVAAGKRTAPGKRGGVGSPGGPGKGGGSAKRVGSGKPGGSGKRVAGSAGNVGGKRRSAGKRGGPRR